MGVRTIHTDAAPGAVGAYEQGRVADGWIHTSGQVALDPETGDWVTDRFREEVRRVLRNLLAVVRAGGGDRNSIVKTTVYLIDLGRYETLNQVYRDVFGDAPPARSVVEVHGLPGEASLEIEAVARQT